MYGMMCSMCCLSCGAWRLAFGVWCVLHGRRVCHVSWCMRCLVCCVIGAMRAVRGLVCVVCYMSDAMVYTRCVIWCVICAVCRMLCSVC